MTPSSRTPLTRLSLLGAILIAFSLLLTGLITPPAKAAPKAPNGMLGIVPQALPTRKDTRRMKAGGIDNMRLALAWNNVQSVNAKSFNWAVVDEIVKVAAREGMRVMPFLYGTPAWLSKRSTNMPVENKNQLDKWRAFVKAAVERYGSKGDFWEEGPYNELPKKPVHEWQIWNEANFHYFTTPVSPAKYGRLLDASARVIHKTDPKAEVVVSGLFAKPKGANRRAMDADIYIKRLVKHSMNRSIDSIAIHPYSSDTADLESTMKEFRRAAIKAGLRKKSVQITEIGWGSGPATNAFLKGSKGAQAQQLKSAFNYLVGKRKSLRLKNVYWFSWRDSDPKAQNCSFCYTIGLFAYRKGNTLVPKPAWRQFVRFTRGKY